MFSSQFDKSKEDQERQANLWRLVKQQKKHSYSILDGKYRILRTIGDGRYARVKLAEDTQTNKQVAIKFLRVHPGISKHKALECLLKEIKILSQCDNPYIVKIIEASVDGVLVKESGESLNANQINTDTQHSTTHDIQQEESNVPNIKKKVNICYYVMKLAEYGELFRFIEHTEKFTERLSRTLFLQLLQGLLYLHRQGVAHRDIKPENILIDKKCRIIIADFGFAIQLPKSEQSSESLYESYIHKSRLVGSEDYNAPEIVSEEIYSDISIEQEMKQKQEEEQHTGSITNQSTSDNQSAKQSPSNSNIKKPSLYDPMKADIFSAAATLFLMVMRCPPFRKAHQKDPYFKRLCSQDRKHFWNIFKGIPCSSEFKDLFEKLTKRDPEERPGLQHILNHQWLQSNDKMEFIELQEELNKRYQFVEKTTSLDFQQLNQKEQQLQNQHDLELMMKDNEEFEQLREKSIDEIEYVSKKIKYNKGLKKIKKATFGNMIDQTQFTNASMLEHMHLDDSHNDNYQCHSGQKSSFSTSNADQFPFSKQSFDQKPTKTQNQVQSKKNSNDNSSNTNQKGNNSNNNNSQNCPKNRNESMSSMGDRLYSFDE